MTNGRCIRRAIDNSSDCCYVYNRHQVALPSLLRFFYLAGYAFSIFLSKI